MLNGTSGGQESTRTVAVYVYLCAEVTNIAGYGVQMGISIIVESNLAFAVLIDPLN